MSMKAGPSFRPPQSSPQLVDEAEEEEDYVLAGSSNEPPPYSSPVVSPGGPSAASSSSRRPLAASTIPTPWLPDLDFSRYSIADATVSKDGTTIVTTSPVLSHDSKALLRFIQDQASLPPLPYIRIVGTPPPGQSRPDFDIKLNMLRYFLPRQQTNSSTTNSTSNWNYVRLVGENELAFRGKSTQTTTPTVKSLEQWAWKFCNEKSSVKTFVLDRQVTNWDTNNIEGQIRSLIAATGYTRHVSVTFPVHYSKIVIQPPRTGGEGFFTTLFGGLMDKKRYEVVRAVWPYASLPPGMEAKEAGRVCAVQAEEAWWRDWREVLRLAILGKRCGWVSIDDLLYYKMLPVEPELPKYPWDS